MDVDAALRSLPIAADAHRVSALVGHPAVPDALEAVSIWPPAAIRFTTGSGWTATGVDLQGPGCLSLPISLSRLLRSRAPWSVPLAEPLSGLPEVVRVAVELQPDPVAWRLLRLIHELPELVHIAVDNPALAGLLAEYAHSCGLPELAVDNVRELLAGPRRDLLPLVGLPPRQALLKVLAKLDPCALVEPGPEAVIALLSTEDDRVAKWLTHLPRLRADVVSVLSKPALHRLCTFALLADRGVEPRWGLHLLLRSIMVGRGNGWVALAPARFDSRLQVWQFHQAMPPTEGGRWDAGEFPDRFPVPIPGAEWAGDEALTVRPVTSASEMLAHAEQEQLCIETRRDYPALAEGGEGAMYIATWLEDGAQSRATVWLRHSEFGWGLQQLALAGNADAPEWLWVAVDEWVMAHESGGW